MYKRQVQEYVKRAIDRAVKLGSRVIVFGSSGAKNVPEGFPYDRAFGQIADALRMIDIYAASAGIHIAIEPLNRQESNIIQNLEEGKKLMTEAGGPSIRLLADYYHFMLEKEPLETLKKRIPDIVHVHFADPDGRSFPKESRKEYEDFFAVLKEGCLFYTSRCVYEPANGKCQDAGLDHIPRTKHTAEKGACFYEIRRYDVNIMVIFVAH